MLGYITALLQFIKNLLDDPYIESKLVPGICNSFRIKLCEILICYLTVLRLYFYMCVTLL
jgi:hypothetical protein